LDDLIADPLLSDEKHALSQSARMAFHSAHYFYNGLMNNMQNAFYSAKKILELAEGLPDSSADKNLIMISALNNYLNSCNETKNFQEFERAFHKLKNLDCKGEDIRLKVKERTLRFELNHCIKLGRFEEGVAICPKVIEAIDHYKNRMQPEILLTFYVNLGYAYFGVADYENSLIWWNRLSDEVNEGFRMDLQLAARIASLICHYELGNQRLLDYMMRSVHRFLYRKEVLGPFEKVLFGFLRKAHDAMGQKEMKTFFKELRDELWRIYKDPQITIVGDYIDLVTWLDSKLENRPFAEIKREKIVKELKALDDAR